MLIGIRKESNGTIYIDKNLNENIDYTKAPYNFRIVSVNHEDCQPKDFNEDLTFNEDKYNSRKTKEQATKRIEELKSLLKSTDYQAIKYAEGEITLDDYLPIKLKRASYRAEINSLEEKIKNMA